MSHWLSFDTETFHDHTGQPSFVRKSLAWILLFAGALILLGVVMFSLASLAVSKEIAGFIIKVLAAITGVVTIAYGAMQGAKGYAQGQAVKSPMRRAPTPKPAKQSSTASTTSDSAASKATGPADTDPKT